MKALLYSDWCVFKGVAKQYPIPVITVALVAVMTGGSSGMTDAASIASSIHTAIVSCGVAMLSFYVFFALFGNDEREGWEAVRLSLPVTRQTVVRSRYAVLLAWIVLLEVLVNLAGLVGGAIASLVLYGKVAFLPLGEAVLLSCVTFAAYLTYLAIETPIFFKMGLTSARMYFTLPFLACMLFTLEPVQRFAEKVGGWLMRTSMTVGTPLMLAGAVAIALVVYAGSMLVSERIYSARDF